MNIKNIITAFGSLPFFTALLSGCSVNGIGMVDVQHYENDSVYAVKIESWGGHLSTNSADFGITLGHAERLYIYPKGEGGSALLVDTLMAHGDGDELIPTDAPLSREMANRNAMAWMTDNGGITIDLNANKIGLSIGLQSRRVIKLPREFSGWVVIRHSPDGALRAYYENHGGAITAE